MPKTLWQRNTPADAQNRVPLAFNCYVIETPQNTVLIETGGGHNFTPQARERMNLPEIPPLPELLGAYRIDTVINTHLHWDHCSGNMIDGKPAFPNARYHIDAGELAYAHTRNARDSVSYIDANYDPLIQSGACTPGPWPGDAGLPIVPGVTVHSAPGHNANLLVVKAESEGETFVMLSDLVPTAEHLKPTWIAAFDLDPLTAIATKTRILAEAAQSKWWCGFGHDMHHAFVRITEDYKLKETLSS